MGRWLFIPEPFVETNPELLLCRAVENPLAPLQGYMPQRSWNQKSFLEEFRSRENPVANFNERLAAVDNSNVKVLISKAFNFAHKKERTGVINIESAKTIKYSIENIDNAFKKFKSLENTVEDRLLPGKSNSGSHDIMELGGGTMETELMRRCDWWKVNKLYWIVGVMTGSDISITTEDTNSRETSGGVSLAPVDTAAAGLPTSSVGQVDITVGRTTTTEVTGHGDHPGEKVFAIMYAPIQYGPKRPLGKEKVIDLRGVKNWAQQRSFGTEEYESIRELRVTEADDLLESCVWFDHAGIDADDFLFDLSEETLDC